MDVHLRQAGGRRGLLEGDAEDAAVLQVSSLHSHLAQSLSLLLVNLSTLMKGLANVCEISVSRLRIDKDPDD